MAASNYPELNEQQIAELKERHKVSKLHMLRAGQGEFVVVRMPTDANWKRFRKQMADEAKRADALETLLRTSIVYPDPPAFDAMLAERPGLLDTFASNLGELAGLEKEIEKKVL